MLHDTNCSFLPTYTQKHLSFSGGVPIVRSLVSSNIGKSICLRIIGTTLLSDKFGIRFTFDDSSTETNYYLNQLCDLCILKEKNILVVDVLIDGNCNWDSESSGTLDVGLYYDFLHDYAISRELVGHGSYYENVAFNPYYSGIVSCHLLRTSVDWMRIIITDRLGIRYECATSTAGRYMITPYGELSIYNIDYVKNFLPLYMVMEVKVRPRLDIADTMLGMYQYKNVLTDRWFPSFNGLTTRAEAYIDISYQDYLDEKEDFGNYPGNYAYHSFYLSELFSIDNNVITVNTTVISSFFANKVLPLHRRAGLLICPSCKTTTEGALLGEETIDGHQQTVYYWFPLWMYNILKPINGIYYFYHNGYYWYNLDWRCETTRQLYKECITKLVDVLYSLTINSQKVWDYIEYIKVGFAGTWGEGFRLDIDPENYPSSDNLIEISEHIINSFHSKEIIEETPPNKIKKYLLPSASVLNGDFPKGYRDYILNSGHGLFFDGVGTANRYMFTEGNGGVSRELSSATVENMNKLYLMCKEKLVYLECQVEENSGITPDYASLEAYIKYCKPDILSINNIFFNNRNTPPDINLLDMLKRLSRYVGTRPYILKNKTSFSSEGQLTVHISIGNYGTALFASYWKLKVYVKVNGVEVYNSYIEGENIPSLQEIPKAFESGIVNYHDTKWFNFDKNTNISVQRTDLIEVLIAIVDADGIFTKYLLFCNTEEFLPRERDASNKPTGRFYLLRSN